VLEGKKIQDYEGRCWKKVLGPDPRIRNPMPFPNIGRNLPVTQGIGRLVAPRRSPRRSLQGYQKAPRIFTEASQKASRRQKAPRKFIKGSKDPRSLPGSS